MLRKLTDATIANYGAEVANLDVPKERAAEMAAEVEGLNTAVHAAAAGLDLNDEPGQFPLALLRNRLPVRRKK